MLFYPGLEVLPSFITYKAHSVDEDRFAEITVLLREKLGNLFVEEPIPYRRQNDGDYDIPAMTLKREIREQEQGLRVHQK